MRKHCTICGKFVRESDCCKPAEISNEQHSTRDFWKGVRNGFLIVFVGSVFAYFVYCVVTFVL